SPASKGRPVRNNNGSVGSRNSLILLPFASETPSPVANLTLQLTHSGVYLHLAAWSYPALHPYNHARCPLPQPATPRAKPIPLSPRLEVWFPYYHLAVFSRLA